jgi:hypothetical protein
VVWVDARDGDAVERSLVVLGFQLLAGVTASQPAPLARAVALEWLGRSEGWVMVIEGDQGPEVARWLLNRFGHGTFAFSVERLPRWPEFYAGFAIEVTDVSGAGEPGEAVPDGHVAILGMGAAGDFGQGTGVIGLYSSPAMEGGDPGAVADRLWALGDYPRAVRLLRCAAGVPGAGGPGAAGERARLENNLGCLYAALLRPKEAIAVLEACRGRLGSPGGGGVPEVLDANLGLCYLQLADLTARYDTAFLANMEKSAQEAHLATVDRLRGKAVEVFEALLRRHAQDPESPDACFLRDCLAFCLFVGHDGSLFWYYDVGVRVMSLFEENRIWYGMTSGESADATLRSRIRWATVAGTTSGNARVAGDPMAELGQVLEIAGETSASVAAQCLLAMSHLAMEGWGPGDLEHVAPYAVRFAEYCLRALGPEHPWSGFAAAHLELIWIQVPASGAKPRAPYAPSVTVWEGPYGATPFRHLEYPMVVPYLLAGDLLGAASRCYEAAAARTAQREAAVDFHAELRAAIERQCDRELGDIRQGAAGTDLSWLTSWLSQALSRDGELLQLAGPGVSPP